MKRSVWAENDDRSLHDLTWKISVKNLERIGAWRGCVVWALSWSKFLRITSYTDVNWISYFLGVPGENLEVANSVAWGRCAALSFASQPSPSDVKTDLDIGVLRHIRKKRPNLRPLKNLLCAPGACCRRATWTPPPPLRRLSSLDFPPWQLARAGRT